MSDLGGLDLLARLAETGERLRRSFPGLGDTLEPRAVLPIVPEMGSTLAQRFIPAVRKAFDPYLGPARIRFLEPRAVMQDLPEGGFDAVWILFSADRFEPRGERFQEWIDSQREALGEAPLFALRLFPWEGLERWGEPIRAEEPELVSGRTVPVLSVAYDSRKGTLGTENGGRAVGRLLGSTLLYVASAGFPTWRDMAAAWDARVAAELDDRIRALRERPGSVPVGHLAVSKLREFWRLHGEAGRGRELVARALELAGELDRVRPSQGQLVQESGRVAVELNDKRLAGFGWTADSAVSFSQEFQRVRHRLLALCAKLREELERNGLQEQAAYFRKVAEDLGAEVSAILLGAFSAGKSTFLNTLLGLTDGNHPLPTGGKPETATINVLRFSTTEGVDVSYLDGLDLDLFSRSPRPGQESERWKILKVEIEALLTWLKLDALELDALRAWRLPLDAPKRRRGGAGVELEPAKLDRRAIGHLIELLDRPQNFLDEEELQDARIPVLLQNLRFRGRPKTPSDLEAAQEFLKRPEVALRVEHAQFRRNLPVLQGLRFVDTPGTDSAISHHHTLARRYIDRTPGAPILYCFDGRRVGSTEDGQNLRFLHGLAAELDRAFFLVTKRPDSAAERDEVRRRAQQVLQAAGWRDKRVYVIDSIEAREHPEDPEWQALTADLRRFVDANRTRLLREQGQGLIESHLEGWRKTLVKQLEDLGSEGAQREGALAELERKIAEIAPIQEQFEAEAKKVRAGLLKGELGSFGEEMEDVIRALGSFDCGAVLQSTKEKKLKEVQELVAPLKDWKKQLKKNLEAASATLHRQLKSRLTASFPDEAKRLMVLPLPPEFQPLDLTEVYAKAAEDVGRSWWVSFRPHLQEKTRRLAALLTTKREETEREMVHVYGRMVSQYKASLRAIEERSWKASQELSGTEQTAAVEDNRRRLAFVERCLAEYRAIHTPD